MVASSQRRRALEHPTATSLMHRHREHIATEGAQAKPMSAIGPEEKCRHVRFSAPIGV